MEDVFLKIKDCIFELPKINDQNLYVLYMKTLTVSDDILVHCVTATSFPDGVQQAHETLHGMFPYDTDRNYFGISRPGKDGIIIYKAAAEELNEGELAKYHLEIMIILKGDYLYIDIPGFSKDIPSIGATFQKLIIDQRIAADGCCIEWYLHQNLCRCMVKINSSTH